MKLFSCLLVPYLLALSSDAAAARNSELRLTPRATSTPTPIVVPASQDWQGNDGPWSAFALQIGSPPQVVQVLISTAGHQTWVVLPQGCTVSDPINCASLRGGEFLTNQSTSWRSNNASEKGLFALGLETNLGYSGNGSYGYDTVGIGWQGSGGPSLNQQVVGGIATKEFYLGLFGLNPRPSNFSTFNDPVPSYMQSLKDKAMIPSLSWSYTAGNQYRLNKVLGSLVLGGYDTSRFVSNDVTFSFNEQDIQDLTVDIETITATVSGNTTTLSSTSRGAFIDSTVPYIFLPLDVCKKFEVAFGITWDNTSQAYLVSETLHTVLQAQNASVTFTLGNLTAGKTVDITLPYAAFDLTASYPLAENATRYFPLMRATNSTQYTLGRTFLQEAYLTADYERRTFSVSQCSWDADAKENIITIHSPTDSSSATSHHPSTASIIGGSIGGFVIILALAICYLSLLRSRRNKARNAKEKEPISPTENPLYGIKGELATNSRTKMELDAYDTGARGSELDARHTQLPGLEIEGTQHFRPELEGRGGRPIYEMAAKEEIASEMPISHAAGP